MPEAIFALTPPQHFLATVDSVKPGCMLGEHNTNAVAYRITGIFDPEILEQAVGLVAQRQRALRGGLTETEPGRLAFILSDTRVRLHRYDLADVRHLGDTDGQIATILSRQAISAYDPPLLRVHLVNLGARGWLVVIAVHELVGDGGSIRVLLRELSSAYRAIEANESLPPLAADYLAYFAERGQPSDRIRGFWRRYLADMPTRSIATDRPKSMARSPALNQVAVVLPETFMSGIRQLTRATRSTPFIIMLAVYAAVMAKKSGSTDVVVPTWWSGREDPATEDIVGLFLRVLPIRLKLTESAPFEDFLQTVRLSAVEAFEYADMPTLSLISDVPEAAEAFGNPEYCWNIFQVIYGPTESDFVFADADAARVFFEANADSEIGSNDFAQDLHFRVIIEAHAIRINATFDESLFDRATVLDLTEQFTALLTRVAENPAVRLDLSTS